MHYLKCIPRDKIGSFRDDEAMRRHLEGWLVDYVGGRPEGSGEQMLAQPLRPLAWGEVRFLPTARTPGTVDAQIELLPYYQLGGLSVPMQLVTALPSMQPPARWTTRVCICTWASIRRRRRRCIPRGPNWPFCASRA